MNPRLPEMLSLVKELVSTMRRGAEISRSLQHLTAATIVEGREAMVELLADADLGELLAEAEALSMETLRPHKLRQLLTQIVLDAMGSVGQAMLRDLLLGAVRGADRAKLTTACTCSECQKPKAPCDCPACKLAKSLRERIEAAGANAAAWGPKTGGAPS